MWAKKRPLDAAMKRQVTQDWSKEFPALTPWKPMRMHRIAGPLMIGVWLDRSSNVQEYRPVAHFHNLMSPGQPICFEMPVYPRRADGLALTTVAGLHEQEYMKLVGLLKAQWALPFEGPVSGRKVMEAIEAFYENNRERSWGVDLVLCQMREWLGEKGAAEAGVRQLTTDMCFQVYAPVLAEQAGMSVDDYLAVLSGNRDALEETVASEIARHKLGKIPRESLLEDLIG